MAKLIGYDILVISVHLGVQKRRKHFIFYLLPGSIKIQNI